MMDLFTLIIDYKGGTHITQSEAKSVKEAPLLCIENWDITDIENDISESDKLLLSRELAFENFEPLKGMTGVWCGGVLLGKHLVLMNLVATRESC